MSARYGVRARVPERAGRRLDDPGLVPRQEEPAQDPRRTGNDQVPRRR